MSYQEFAQIYDVLMEHAPYDKWVDFTDAIVKNYDLNVKQALDLGCGTGEITVRLAEKGFSISGVDLSADMLSQAAMKASEKQLTMSWIHQDIRQLTGFSNVDLCISYCDVMNYITNQVDIKAVFQNVYESLAENGLYLFDVHDYHYAQDSLMDHTFTDVTDELAYIWECERGDKAGEMFHYLTFFAQNQNGYTRFDEVHHQKVYTIDDYKNLLKQAGFSNIEVYQDFNVDNDTIVNQAERIFFLAQK